MHSPFFQPPSPSHDAAVCEIKSIPPATVLPSKSDPTVATTTATHAGGSVIKKKRKKYLSLSSLSLSLAFEPPSFFPSFSQWLEPTSSPSTAARINVAAVR